MSDLYLIAHIVRGEPAFDIATPIKIGEEDAWIIPTSGHRAFPFWKSSLEGILQGELNGSLEDGWLKHILDNVSKDHPDHYSINNKKLPEPIQMKLNLEDLDL